MLSTVFSLACGKCVTHIVQRSGAGVQVAFAEVIMILDLCIQDFELEKKFRWLLWWGPTSSHSEQRS